MSHPSPSIVTVIPTTGYGCNSVRKIRRKQVCRRKTRLRNFRLIGERQCTPKGQARYVNVRGSVQWKRVYRVGGAKFEANFPRTVVTVVTTILPSIYRKASNDIK